MKKILAIVLMAAVLVCPAFASGEPAAQTTQAAAQTAQADCNHDFKVEITTAATCTEKGLLTYSCSKCGLTYTVETVPTGHKPSAAAATCTDAVVCTVCGTVLEPATGHTYSYQYDAEQNEDDTFASFGTWKCDVCGDVVPATEGNAVYYYGLQTEAPAASGEASGEASGSSEEAPAEAELANPDYDPDAHNWGGITSTLAIIIVAVGIVLMLSFGKKATVAVNKED